MTGRTIGEKAAEAIRIDALEDGMAVRPYARLAVIDRELSLSMAGLQTYFAKWEPRLYDLLVVAAAIDFCDLTSHRPEYVWTRKFDLRIAVHEPVVWSSTDVKSALEDAISFLTGDVWEISFVRRRRGASKIENSGLDLKASANVIMPFSDGLDSRAVAALIGADQRGVLRVRLGREGQDQRGPGRRTEAFMTVPYEIKVGKRERRESSARSRGFKFSVITGIAAQLAGIRTIIVTESGQGALGPALAVTGQGYPDYRVHPAFSRKMEHLFATLVGTAPEYQYPRLWNTKAETLTAAAQLNDPPRLLDTRSCWQGSRQVGFDDKRRQCGVCAACLLRRQSVHAANLTELKEAYVWENLSSATFKGGAATGFDRITGALEEYAIAGILHLDHLAGMVDSSLHAKSIRRNARQIAGAVGEEPDIVEAKLVDLLKRHRAEWRAFLKSLGPESFVVKLASVAYEYL